MLSPASKIFRRIESQLRARRALLPGLTLATSAFLLGASSQMTSATSTFDVALSLTHYTLESPLWGQIEENSDQTVFVALPDDDDHSWDATIQHTADNPSHDDDDTTLIPYHHEIQLVASELDADASLIYAVTKAESQFRAHVESGAGAVGLMQVIADRAGVDAYHAVYNVKQAPNEYELKDPYINLKLGTAYLKLLEEKYFHSVKDKKLRQALVLAAYNWGPVNVKKHLMNKNAPRTLTEAKWALWNKAPKETWSYVNKVMKYQQQYDVLDKLDV
ncbi:MAG: transglycosylase SLT domain-containing protein [Hahellaceae bacterium]|nr:transglycosylase SLT domain-containing protein [Hahellaceae bacterium]